MRVVISSGHGITSAAHPARRCRRNATRSTRPGRSVDRTAAIMRDAGHDVTVFHDDISDDQSENLNRIVNFHNAQGPHDWDVSMHFNAYDRHSPRMRGALCLEHRRDDG